VRRLERKPLYKFEDCDDFLRVTQVRVPSPHMQQAAQLLVEYVSRF
jgi:hypothetical protein